MKICCRHKPKPPIEPCCPQETCCPQPCCPQNPCCPQEPCSRPDFYAQYRVIASPASGGFLALSEAFRKGEGISLANDNVIVLSPGYLYLISYLFLGTPESDSYMEIVPYINGTPRLLYSFFAPTGSERNTSAAGSFTTVEADGAGAELSFRLTYPDVVRNIDITGSVSVTPLMEL